MANWGLAAPQLRSDTTRNVTKVFERAAVYCIFRCKSSWRGRQAAIGTPIVGACPAACSKETTTPTAPQQTEQYSRGEIVECPGICGGRSRAVSARGVAGLAGHV